jgi:hypothetical protein
MREERKRWFIYTHHQRSFRPLLLIALLARKNPVYESAQAKASCEAVSIRRCIAQIA